MRRQVKGKPTAEAYAEYEWLLDTELGDQSRVVKRDVRDVIQPGR